MTVRRSVRGSRAQRGEGNLKFVVYLVVLGVFGYLGIVNVPRFFNMQSLKADAADLARTTGVQGIAVEKVRPKELFEREYENVIWIIRTPNSDIWDLYLMNQTKPEDLFVKSIPLCRKCKTEIAEKKILFKKYRWFCINCGFQYKTKLSLYSACENIKKIIRGEFRKFRFDEEKKIL